MKKNGQIAIITNFSTYEPRAEAVGKFFSSKGLRVTYIFSDFLHREKRKRVNYEDNHIYLNTKQYTKNISVQRIWSHYKFSKDLQRLLIKKNFDFLYILVPANSLLLAGRHIKRKSNTKLIVDVIDLWPESMISPKLSNLPIINRWKKMRQDGLKDADWIFTECDLYHDTLRVSSDRLSTLYWKKGPRSNKYAPELNDSTLNVAYIGSINNIIDITFIANILSQLNKIKPVVLHIIGDGEKRLEFISSIENKGIKVEFHGPIYDNQKKLAILKTCVCGLNIMKPKVKVGLTMKSVEYFYYGLPIINNISGDTSNFVNKYKVGINVNEYNYKQFLKKNFIAGMQSRENIQNFYNSRFSDLAFEKRLSEIFNKWKEIW